MTWRDMLFLFWIGGVFGNVAFFSFFNPTKAGNDDVQSGEDIIRHSLTWPLLWWGVFWDSLGQTVRAAQARRKVRDGG